MSLTQTSALPIHGVAPQRIVIAGGPVELSTHIRYAYEDYGFRLVELIKSTVADRRRQVLDYLGTHPARGPS